MLPLPSPLSGSDFVAFDVLAFEALAGAALAFTAFAFEGFALGDFGLRLLAFALEGPALFVGSASEVVRSTVDRVRLGLRPGTLGELSGAVATDTIAAVDCARAGLTTVLV